MKRVISSLAKGFVCKLCADTMEEISFFNQVDFVKCFCYYEDKLNVSDGSEAAVTARTRIGWMKFRECGELLCGRKFSSKMKGRIYQSCVR